MFEEANRKQNFKVKSPDIRKYLYLDLSIEELIDKMRNLQFSEVGNDKEVPFNASVRSYTGARDEDGDWWCFCKKLGSYIQKKDCVVVEETQEKKKKTTIKEFWEMVSGRCYGCGCSNFEICTRDEMYCKRIVCEVLKKLNKK